MIGTLSSTIDLVIAIVILCSFVYHPVYGRDPHSMHVL